MVQMTEDKECILQLITGNCLYYLLMYVIYLM